jgi:hypothetical protein
MGQPGRATVLGLLRQNPLLHQGSFPINSEEGWYKKYGLRSRAFSGRMSVTVSEGYLSLYVQTAHHLAQVKIRTVAIS